MKEYKIIKQRLNFPNYGEFISISPENSLKYSDYGIFSFVTVSEELAILNFLEKKNNGIDSISSIFNELINEYDFKEYKINGIRQDAWRYFADKSANGDIWHMYYMSGTPFKNELTDEEKYSIQLIDEDVFFVDLQEITFNKWLSLSTAEQKKHMRLFLDNPVKGSDYIFKHTFHT